jgi:HEAT repeat protein
MEQTLAETGIRTGRPSDDKQVETILAQMAAVLKNIKTYDVDNPVMQKSFSLLSHGLLDFLSENESLTLLVREDALVYGNVAVYESASNLDSLAFVFYRDGIRLISFLDGMTGEDLWKFMLALNEARSADPYEADLVTILWEQSISGLRYKAVDAYLEDKEEKKIEELISDFPDDPIEPARGAVALGPAFFIHELGLSPRGSSGTPKEGPLPVTEAGGSSLVQEIFKQDDHSLMKQCSEICLELARFPENDEMFNSIVPFLGRICDWLVSWGDLLSASSVISELRAIIENEDDVSPRKASVLDAIARLGESAKIERVSAFLDDIDKTRLDEVFAYLAMMEPVAVRPLFDILADCEIRDVRYMLCRVLSIIARHEPDRLRLFLLDRRWYVVRNAVTILGLIGSADAIPVLGSTSRHSEARVRKEVARALGRMKDPAGLTILADLASDQEEAVRLEALRAIEKVGVTDALGFMEDWIKDKKFEKRSSDERTEVFKLIGAVGKAGLEVLQQVIRGEIPRLSDKTRAAAVHGLAAVGSKESSEILNELKDSISGDLRSTVMEVLSMGENSVNWEKPDED